MSHDRVTCSTKEPYPSRLVALRVLRAQVRSSDHWGGRRPALKVYKCGWCQGWHIGRADPAARKRNGHEGEAA